MCEITKMPDVYASADVDFIKFYLQSFILSETIQYLSSPIRSVSGPVLSKSSEGEGWQPVIFWQIWLKEKTAGKLSPLLICIFMYSHSYSYMHQFGCQSSLMTLHSWDDEVKRVGGKSLLKCVCSCSCLLHTEEVSQLNNESSQNDDVPTC